MTWTSYAEQQKGLPATAIKADEMTIRVKTSDKHKPRLIIRLGLDVIKKGKLQIGDTVDLLASEDKAKALIKKADKGWKLKKSGNQAAVIDLPWADNRLFTINQKKAAKLEYQISNGGITFDIPKEVE